MTVGELREQLKRFHQDAEVTIWFGETRLKRTTESRPEREMDPRLTPVRLAWSTAAQSEVHIIVQDDHEKKGVFPKQSS